MSDIENKIKQLLSDIGISYEWLNIDSNFADTAAFCDRYGFSMEESANTIIVASKKGSRKYCACLVLATDRLDVNKKVKSLMQVSRVSFAKENDTRELTGMMVGGVTVIGLPESLPIYVDQRVMKQPRIVIGGGNRSGKIILSPLELTKIPNVDIIEGLSMFSQ